MYAVDAFTFQAPFKFEIVSNPWLRFGFCQLMHPAYHIAPGWQRISLVTMYSFSSGQGHEVPFLLIVLWTGTEQLLLLIWPGLYLFSSFNSMPECSCQNSFCIPDYRLDWTSPLAWCLGWSLQISRCLLVASWGPSQILSLTTCIACMAIGVRDTWCPPNCAYWSFYIPHVFVCQNHI